jgi:hypothetical protein
MGVEVDADENGLPAKMIERYDAIDRMFADTVPGDGRYEPLIEEMDAIRAALPKHAFAVSRRFRRETSFCDESRR